MKKNTTQPSFFPTFQNNVLVRSSQVHCIYSSHSCMAVYLSAKMMISIRVDFFAALRIRRHALQASNAAPGRCGETRLRINHTNSRNSKGKKTRRTWTRKENKSNKNRNQYPPEITWTSHVCILWILGIAEKNAWFPMSLILNLSSPPLLASLGASVEASFPPAAGRRVPDHREVPPSLPWVSHLRGNTYAEVWMDGISQYQRLTKRWESIRW